MEQHHALTKLKNYARKLKQNLFLLYLSYKDSRVPCYAKLVAICVVAYAFSPIDLIPDFIPILGYLDDLIIVPLGISLALKLIPPFIIEENRAKAEEIRQKGKPKNWFVAVLFMLIWLFIAIWISKYFVDNKGR
ncbi:YkvA family protein [Neobacillus sp. PS2-9]|uniref:YkvA family protein n=1 Tax=Neobacillus sp. PS2-9 TaxID=3070676 RepID=UPI0027E04613|nr:YkvA family protein [Neobacillus sp. PS2-9]WML58669.1 YkvA family protein [Neobacillus sp. PS2-9]